MDGLNLMKLVDQRVAPNKVRTNAICVGPASVTYVPVNAVPNSATYVPVWTVVSPSQQAGLSRCLRIRAQVTTVINVGTNQAQAAAWAAAANIAPRQFCLQQAMTSITLQLNDTVLSMAPQRYLAALLQVANHSTDMNAMQSTCASAPDVLSDYNAAAQTAANPGVSSNVIPFGNDNPYPRGSYISSITAGANAGAGTGTVTVVTNIVEPLVIPPFQYVDNMSEHSLFQINTLVISPQFATGLPGFLTWGVPGSGAVSVPPPAGNTAITGGYAPGAGAQVSSFTGNLVLETSWVVPSSTSLISPSVPCSVAFTNVQIWESQFQIGSSATGAANVSQANSQSIETSVIPAKFLVFATQPDAVINNDAYPQPRCFFPLSNVSVQYAGRAGLLSGASSAQLYDLSRRGGLIMSYNQWSANNLLNVPAITTAVAGVNAATANGFFAGGVLCIDTASDLSLDPGLAPGVPVKTSFIIQCTVTNTQLSPLGTITYVQPNIAVPNPAALNAYRFCVVTLQPGILTSFQGRTTQQLSLCTPQQVIEAPCLDASASILLSDVKSRSGFTGGSFDDFLTGFRMITEPAAHLLGAVLGAGESGGSGSMGAGKSGGGASGGFLMGGSVDGPGSEYAGGARMTRSRMAQRMK